ncbi:unnamed protein product, partial [Amoebophrya sp. A25]
FDARWFQDDRDTAQFSSTLSVFAGEVVSADAWNVTAQSKRQPSCPKLLLQEQENA